MFFETLFGPLTAQKNKKGDNAQDTDRPYGASWVTMTTSKTSIPGMDGKRTGIDHFSLERIRILLPPFYLGRQDYHDRATRHISRTGTRFLSFPRWCALRPITFSHVGARLYLLQQ